MDDKYFEDMKEKYKNSFIMLRLYEILNELENEHIDLSDNNVIKFICRRSFHDLFSIKIEWKNNEFMGLFVLNVIPMRSIKEENVKHYVKLIKIEHIEKLLSILEKYKYFEESNYIERHGLDGASWKVQIKIMEKYKELDIWSPDDGVVYDIGKYLISLSDIDLGQIY